MTEFSFNLNFAGIHNNKSNHLNFNFAGTLMCTSMKTNPLLLLLSRCPRDSSYATYYSPSSHFARFKFNAFEFMSRHPSVYLKCQMLVCRLGDYSSHCYRGCSSRPKRDTSSAEEQVDVVVGPLQLRGGDAPSGSTGKGE